MTLVLNGSTGVSAVDGSASTPAIQGNDTNTGVFFPAADTVGISTNGTERMRVDSSGNVGIGTGSPISALSVAGSATAPSSVDTLSIYNLQDGGAGIGFVNATTSAANPLGSIRALVEGTGSGTNDGVLQFGTALNGVSFERARIDSMGNMGLGVTPQAWDSNYKVLQVNSYGAAFGATTAGAVQVSMSSNAYYASGSWKGILTGSNASLYRQEGGVHIWSYATSVTSGTNFSFAEAMRIDTAGNVGIGTNSITTAGGRGLQVFASSSAANVRVTYTGYTGVDVIQGSNGEGYLWNRDNRELLFGTNNAERARISSGGDLLVGTSNGSFSGGVGFKIATNGAVGAVSNTNGSLNTYHYYNENATNNGYRFYVKINGGIDNYSANNTNISDQRVKKDIQDAPAYLDKLCAIPVRTFLYKDQEDDWKNVGVIAQEVEAVAPEFINNDGWGDGGHPADGPLKSVYETDLKYAMLKAIQELNAKVEGLQAEINALKGAA